MSMKMCICFHQLGRGSQWNNRLAFTLACSNDGIVNQVTGVTDITGNSPWTVCAFVCMVCSVKGFGAGEHSEILVIPQDGRHYTVGTQVTPEGLPCLHVDHNCMGSLSIPSCPAHHLCCKQQPIVGVLHYHESHMRLVNALSETCRTSHHLGISQVPSLNIVLYYVPWFEQVIVVCCASIFAHEIRQLVFAIEEHEHSLLGCQHIMQVCSNLMEEHVFVEKGTLT